MFVCMCVAYGRPNRWAVWAKTLRGDCWHPGDGFRPVGWPVFDAILTSGGVGGGVCLFVCLFVGGSQLVGVQS